MNKRKADKAGDTGTDPGYAQGELGVKPEDASPEPATEVERAAAKPTAAPDAVPLPDQPEQGRPGINPGAASGG